MIILTAVYVFYIYIVYDFNTSPIDQLQQGSIVRLINAGTGQYMTVCNTPDGSQYVTASGTTDDKNSYWIASITTVGTTKIVAFKNAVTGLYPATYDAPYPVLATKIPGITPFTDSNVFNCSTIGGITCPWFTLSYTAGSLFFINSYNYKGASVYVNVGITQDYKVPSCETLLSPTAPPITSSMWTLEIHGTQL